MNWHFPVKHIKYFVSKLPPFPTMRPRDSGFLDLLILRVINSVQYNQFGLVRVEILFFRTVDHPIVIKPLALYSERQWFVRSLTRSQQGESYSAKIVPAGIRSQQLSCDFGMSTDCFHYQACDYVGIHICIWTTIFYVAPALNLHLPRDTDGCSTI